MKFSSDSYWFKSGFYSLAQNVSNLIFGFGGFYLLVRILDKNGMGGWVLFVTVTSILEVARVGFIKYAFIKYRAEASDEDKGKLFTASFVLNCAFAALVALGAIIFGGTLAALWKVPELKRMFYLYAVTSFLLIPFFQFEYFQHAVMDFRRVFFTYFIRTGFLFFSILFSYLGLFKLDLFSLTILNLLGALIASMASYILMQKPIQFSLMIDWSWVWKIIHFGKFVVGTSLGSMLFSAVDQFMLGSLLTPASVAIYNVASRIINLINIPSMSLSVIIFPHSARLITVEGKPGVKKLYEKSVAAILAIVLPGVFFVLLFPGLVIHIIAGPGYVETVAVLQVSIFLCFFLPFAYQFGVTLDSIGYPNLNFYFTGSFFLINLTLNYFLISNYGVIGAAYGTLSTTIVGFIAMQVLLRFLIGVDVTNVFRNLLDIYVMVASKVRVFIIKSVS